MARRKRDAPRWVSHPHATRHTRASSTRVAVRTREYDADEDGSRLTGDPLALANALNKLENGIAARPLQPTPQLQNASRTLVLHGVCDRVRGDGDAHMRGIGCLLTGAEFFPGNIQGGSDTPAGWAKGISIDQEIRNYLQSNPATRTRFGSLAFFFAPRLRAAIDLSRVTRP